MFVSRNFSKIVITLFLFLFCLPLTRQGMFVDGVWYAAIAKNMAAGLGSIWDPALSKTMFLHFREHPPLAMAMQSLFFQYLGIGFWVERLYCVLLAGLQIFVCYKLWRQNLNAKSNRSNSLNNHWWWFLFLWLMIPVNIGMYKNNLLEGSLTLFSTLACLALIRNFQSTKSFIVAAIFSSACLVAGFMCNGPTVLFPLAIPFLYGWIIEKKSIKLITARTLLLTAITALSFLIFFIAFPAALENLKGYFKIQLMAAITGDRDMSFTGWKHFYIVYIYMKDYIAVFLAGIGAIALQARMMSQPFLKLFKSYTQDPWFRFYLLLSLCASLPVGLSHRQMFHYISPSAPIVLLAMMHLTHHAFSKLMPHMERQTVTKASKYIGSLLTLLCVVSMATIIYKSGGYNKNQYLIEDVKQTANFLSQGQFVKGSPQVMNNFEVPANFARYSEVSFLEPNDNNSQYYIYYPNEPLPIGYTQLKLGLRYFKLGRRIPVKQH